MGIINFFKADHPSSNGSVEPRTVLKRRHLVVSAENKRFVLGAAKFLITFTSDQVCRKLCHNFGNYVININLIICLKLDKQEHNF